MIRMTNPVPTLRRVLLIFFVVSVVRTVGYNNYGYNKYNYGYDNDVELELSVCDDSVVRLTQLTIRCDSPYTFYYGNGANRDSSTCDYGDKATLSGYVKVVDDLQYGDQIYVTIAIYDDNKNLLVTVDPTNFCDTYIGSDCTVGGTYSFGTKLKFERPENKNQTHFVPVVQMAFSTKADSGYNLGAVNTQCQKWDQDNPSYVDWSGKTPLRSPLRVFVADNGMLIGTCVALAAFAGFVWNRARDEEDERVRETTSRNVSFVSLE